MNTAKLSLPFPTIIGPIQPALKQALGGRATLFSAPAGYVSTSRLSGLLQEQHSPLIWLRAGQEDRDPAALLIALANGAEMAFPAVGRRTLERMRATPGPVFGWAPLYSGLARDICEAVHGQPGLVLVIQHLDALYAAPQALTLLQDIFIPLLPSGTSIILISHLAPPRGTLSGFIQQVSTRDLRMEETGALLLAQDCLRGGGFAAQGNEFSLPPSETHGLPITSLRRMVKLSDGCAAALTGLGAAHSRLGSSVLRQVIDAASGRVDLLARVSRLCLQASQLHLDELLSLALCLGYLHPDLAQTTPALQASLGSWMLSPGWLQPLSGGWLRPDCVWQEPLRLALPARENNHSAELKSAANHLAKTGEVEIAFPLLLKLHCYEEAADVLLQAAEPMLNLGQWDTLGRWLAALPKNASLERPWLAYIEGELAAAQGQTHSAQRIFGRASRQFAAQGNPGGACQSLLAESILASRQEQNQTAVELARQVDQLAADAHLEWYRCWASWQLGCLAAGAGQMGEAITHYSHASAAAEDLKDSHMAGFFGQALGMARTLLQFEQTLALQRQALMETTQAGRAAADEMHFFLQKPTPPEMLLSQYGWAQVPLSLKLPADYALPLTPPFPAAGQTTPTQRGIAGLLRGLFHRQTKAHPPARSIIPVTAEPIAALPTPLPHSTPSEAPAQPAVGISSSGVKEHTQAPAAPVVPQAHAPQPVKGCSKPAALNACLLGSFRVALEDNAIDSWPNGRSRAVFAYLLAQHGRQVSRDVLMDTFWPDTGIDSARNSLNVAIHSLRQALKTVLEAPLILYRETSYQINPDLLLWVDVEEFEQHVRTAHQLEMNGSLAEAVREYEMAVSLYQGDFLADSPYEDWASLERERLRVSFLDTLDHLSLVYFNQGQFGACVSLCQRMLSQDACREDAHCRLMRCYSRLGQAHLALRQFQACADALRAELDVSPSPATRLLNEQIKRQEAV